MTKSEVIASIGTRDWAQIKTSGGSTIAALENAGVAFVAGNGGGLGVSFKKVRAPLANRRKATNYVCATRKKYEWKGRNR